MSTAIAKEESRLCGDSRASSGRWRFGKFSAAERLNYYKAICKALGLNPLSQPFQYITLNGKLTLYARKDATDQLRKMHNVSIRSSAVSTSTMST